MSSSAKTLFKSKKQVLSASTSLLEDLYAEGCTLIGSRLHVMDGSYDRKLTPELASEVPHLPAVEFENSIAHLSKGAQWMAKKIRFGAAPDLKKLASDWAATKEIRRWADSKPVEYWSQLGIVDPAGQLLWHGIRFAEDAERFIALYQEVRNPERVFNSSKQVCIGKVAAIALTSNYNRLPVWVKYTMVRAEKFIPSFVDGGRGCDGQKQPARIGNIWRLIPCAKAWKWAPGLPKGLAEKVGKLSPKARVIAALAWKNVLQYPYQQSRWEERDIFWAEFRKLSLTPAIALARLVKNASDIPFFSAMEVLIGLPHGTLERQRISHLDNQDVEDLLVGYLSPAGATAHLLGCTGRATVKAFQESHRNAIKWASALAYGNPDACQQFLAISKCVEFQPDAIALLKDLGWRSALRLIQKTEFRYRGETHPVSDYHVRDTGYLYNQISSRPDLGRARCWFSLHEELAAAYIEELPDEDIRIPDGWERVDGLSDVFGNWEIELPRRVAQLKFWGQAFSNCVGGYGAAINSGRSIVFAVKQNGLLSHCVEVAPSGALQQFLSHGNQQGDWSLRESVTAALTQAGLLKEDKWI